MAEGPTTESSGTELRAAVAEAAGALGLDATAVADGVSYAIGGVVVVVVNGATAEFRLRPDIAAAAARTPDAAASPRGPEWVAFVPRTLDRFARDRMAAWCQFAVRQVRES